MIVKVCGMRRLDNILQVAALKVDWIGFIFWPGSKRYVTPEDGELLRENLKNAPFRKVGVFVNTPVEDIAATATRYKLDYLQLHGNEPAEVCRTLSRQGFRIIKAFPVAAAEDLRQTALYEGLADYFLFDTKCDGYGGSGQSFDWSLPEAYRGQTPFLLSGGLRPESRDNIRRFRHPRLAGFDLNSGFEIAPGLKDIDKLAPIVRDLQTNKPFITL